MTDLLELAAPRRAVRADAYPEFTEYHDSGCELAPSCLNCPFPVCRYDVAGGVGALLRAPRDGAIREAVEGGEPREAIAERFGVSTRTVCRALGRTGARANGLRPLVAAAQSREP